MRAPPRPRSHAFAHTPTRVLGRRGREPGSLRCSPQATAPRPLARWWGPAPLRALEAQRGRRLARAAGARCPAIGRGAHLSPSPRPAAPPLRRGVLNSPGCWAAILGREQRQGWKTRRGYLRSMPALLGVLSRVAGAGNPESPCGPRGCPSPASETRCPDLGSRHLEPAPRVLSHLLVSS